MFPKTCSELKFKFCSAELLKTDVLGFNLPQRKGDTVLDDTDYNLLTEVLFYYSFDTD